MAIVGNDGEGFGGGETPRNLRVTGFEDRARTVSADAARTGPITIMAHGRINTGSTGDLTHAIRYRDRGFGLAKGAVASLANCPHNGDILTFDTRDAVIITVAVSASYSAVLTPGRCSGPASVLDAMQITAGDANAAPIDIAIDKTAMDEKIAEGANEALVQVDPDTGDTFTYSVHDARFETLGVALKHKEGLSPDQAVEATVLLDVTVTDTAGLSVPEPNTTSFSDGSETLAIFGIQTSAIFWGADFRALISTDKDCADTFFFSVDESRFAAVGGRLNFIKTKSR